MEDIDTTIKKRQEKKKLEEDTDLALKEKDKAIGLLVSARRDLEKARKDKEDFIKDREIEMKQKFLDLENRIVKGHQDLTKLEEDGLKVAVDIENLLKTATDGSLSLLTRAEELVDRADYLKNQAEATIGALNKAKEDLDTKIIKNSELEKEVLKREKEVEIKNQKAEEKLKQAKDLAYWHKRPGAEYKEQ